MQIEALEQLVAADHGNAVGHQAEARLQLPGAKVQSAGGGQRGGAEDLLEPLILGRRGRNDEHVLPGRGGLELVAHLVDVAAEPLDRFDPQMAGGLHRSDRHRGQRRRRIAIDLRQRGIQAVRILRPLEPFEEMPGLLLNVGRLNQCEPAALGQEIGKVLAIVVAGHKGRYVDRLQVGQAALRGHFEMPQRLDLVAEELDPHRLQPIGGKNVENAAAAGKLARQFDRARGLEPVLDQPGEQPRRVDLAAAGQPACLPAERCAGEPVAGSPGYW